MSTASRRFRPPYGTSTAIGQVLLMSGEFATSIDGRAYVGDGVTLGGVPQAKKSEVDVLAGVVAGKASSEALSALSGVVAGKATIAALTALDQKVDQIEAAQLGGLIAVATWAEAAALTGLTAGQVVKVYGPDAGTHTDPVVGGTVANTGVFSYSTSPAGLERIADLEAEAAEAFADAAAASAAVLGGLLPELPLGLGSTVETVKLTEDAGTITPTCYQAVAWTSGDDVVIEVIARAAGRRRLNVFCNTGLVVDVTFDLTTLQVLETAGQGAITDLGGGFRRLVVTETAAATASGNLQLRPRNDDASATYAGDGASGVIVDDVFVHLDGSTTPLIAQRKPTHADWTKSGLTAAAATVTTDTGGARLGAVEATLTGRAGSKLVEGSGSGSPSLYRGQAFTNGQSYTAWAVAAAGERKRLNIFCNAGALFDATFDLEAGTCSGTGAAITPMGNGEFLCAVTVAASASTSGNVQFRVFPASGGHPYAGDGTSGLFLAEAGVRQGSGDNLFFGADAFTGDAWTKAAMTVTPNARTFGALLDRMAAAEAALEGGSPLAGLKWAALGTSITEQGQYTSALASSTGMVLTNLGFSGGSLGQASNGHVGSLAITNRIASIPVDAELVTLEVGINDFAAAAVPLGALGDTTTATFHGALYAATAAIQTRAPGARIVFLIPFSGGPDTPTHRIGVANANGNTLQQFQQAVEDVAEYVSWPWIDMRGLGLGYFTSAANMSDGLHLNEAGGARYAAYVKAKLEDLFAAGFFG